MTPLSTTHDRTPAPDDDDLCGLFDEPRGDRVIKLKTVN